MVEEPIVSVIMSVNKEGKHLTETINSILNQSYQNIEFIIVSDGGGSSLLEILNSYSDSRMVVIDQVWKGITKSLNNAIRHSSGKYIARIDTDDISLPDRILKQVKILDENPQIGLVGTSYLELSEKGEKVSETIFSTDSEKLKNDLLFQNQFCHGTVMFRRKCIEKVGSYREEFIRSQDYDFWLRIAEHFKITNISEILYTRRIEKDSISIALKNEQNMFSTIARECAKARRKGKKEPLSKLRGLQKSKSPTKLISNFEKRRRQFYYDFHRGRSLFGQRKFKLARSFFYNSLKNLPYHFVSWGFLLFTFLPIHMVDKIEPYWKRVQSLLKISI